MNEKLIKLLKEKPFIIPKVLINNYRSLGITDSEFIIIIDIMNYGEKVIFNPEIFAEDIGSDKTTIMKLINSLSDKNIISIVLEKHDKKTYEYISLDVLYEKLYNTIIGKESTPEIDNSVFAVFEGELGRTMSPMEYEKIKEWITSGNSNEIIILALKEAIMNGVNNFNYIDSILNTWRKKGYKNKEDIMKDKENHHNKKEPVEIFETDWLNE